MEEVQEMGEIMASPGTFSRNLAGEGKGKSSGSWRGMWVNDKVFFVCFVFFLKDAAISSC